MFRSKVGKARSCSSRMVFPTVASRVCNSAPGGERTSTTSEMFPSFRLTLIVEVFPTSTITDGTIAFANPLPTTVTA